MATPTASGRITRDDLEASFRDLEGDVTDQVESAKSTALAAGLVAAAVILLLAFFLGVRKGRKRSTVVEIRRV